MRTAPLLLALSSLLAGCIFDGPVLRAFPDQGAVEGPVADTVADTVAYPEGQLPDGPPAVDAPPTAGLQLFFRNAGKELLEDLVVPVFLTPSRFDYAAAAADGSDLRFYDDDGLTALPHEIERWAPGGTSCVWVRVPRVEHDSNSDFIALRYGDVPGAPPPTGVWQTDFHAVYHLSDDLAATPPQVEDSGPQAFHGTLADAEETSGRSVEGQLAGALAFSGERDQHVLLGSPPQFDVESGEAIILEAWFKAEPGSQGGAILYKEYDCAGWSIVMTEQGVVMARFATGYGCNGAQQQDVHLANWGFSYADGRWHYVALVLDRPQHRAAFYVDGELVAQGTTNDSFPAANEGQAKIGNNWNDRSPFDGQLDEIRVGARARGAAWIAAQHAAGRDTLLRYVPR